MRLMQRKYSKVKERFLPHILHGGRFSTDPIRFNSNAAPSIYGDSHFSQCNRTHSLDFKRQFPVEWIELGNVCQKEDGYLVENPQLTSRNTIVFYSCMENSLPY